MATKKVCVPFLECKLARRSVGIRSCTHTCNGNSAGGNPMVGISGLVFYSSMAELGREHFLECLLNIREK